MNAINDAIREIYPSLFEELDITSLVTGNWLPNGHFRDWTVATYPDKWGVTNATAAATTTAGLYWGDNKSALVTASAADGYMYITSNDYPRLLDLQGETVDFSAWAYPSTANDAFLTIYTVSNDGTTTQTLNSTTTAAASKWKKLELNTQAINDNLSEIQFRLRVHTSAQTCYFDHAVVTGSPNHFYLLPNDIRDGGLQRVMVHSDGDSDDLRPQFWHDTWAWDIKNDGTDQYLYLPREYSTDRHIRLIGQRPLAAVSAYTDTINLSGEKINLLIAYAKYKLYQAIEGPVSSEDIGRYETQSAKAYGEYIRLKSTLGMNRMSGQMEL